jgi:AcrR family transcriptional regulator
MILDAAISAIEEYGPDALTGQIAERAGVPRTHVYRHFDGKPALDLAVSRAVARQLSERFRAAMSVHGSTREIVHALIEPFLEWVEANPNLYRFLARHAFAVNEPGSDGTGADDAKSVLAAELSLMTASYVAMLGGSPALLGRGVAGLVGLVDSSATWWLEHPGESRAELAAELTEEVVVLLVRMARKLGLDLDPDAQLPELTLE